MINSQKTAAAIWWLPLLEGITLLLLGLLFISAPGMTLATIVMFMGAFWMMGGIFSIVRIFVEKTSIHWFWLLLKGILGVLAGLIVLEHPLLSAVLVPTLVVLMLGIDGIILGILGIYQGIKMDGTWPVVLGLVNITLGVVLLSHPVMAAVLLPVVMGFFSMVGGISLILFAFRFRRFMNEVIPEENEGTVDKAQE